jgi:putative oxidoreductase
MQSLVRRMPWLSLNAALTTLRIATAIFFMAHAAMRIYNQSIPQFAGFLADRGWPGALLIVYAVTACELVAGALMICNRHVRCAAAALIFIALMGIVIIHAQLGWFVGEHGSGGMEYSVSLMVSLLVIAAADRERHDGR